MSEEIEISEELKKLNTQKISRLLGEVYDIVRQCELLAEEAGLEFSLDVAYGMGGTYVSEVASKGYRYSEGSGWHPSSHSC